MDDLPAPRGIRRTQKCGEGRRTKGLLDQGSSRASKAYIFLTQPEGNAEQRVVKTCQLTPVCEEKRGASTPLRKIPNSIKTLLAGIGVGDLQGSCEWASREEFARNYVF